MAEYIDRDKLVKELECGIRAGNYEKGYDGYAHINSIDDCVDTVKNFDKADVIPLDRIKKVREKIFENVYRYSGTGNEVLQSYCDGFNYCLKLIDNLIESADVISIPEGATNGDMIKAMFPDAKVNNTKYSYVVEVKLPYHSKYDTGLLFDKDWWNAPYKRGREEVRKNDLYR
jgi:hypothetical protein